MATPHDATERKLRAAIAAAPNNPELLRDLTKQLNNYLTLKDRKKNRARRLKETAAKGQPTSPVDEEFTFGDHRDEPAPQVPIPQPKPVEPEPVKVAEPERLNLSEAIERRARDEKVARSQRIQELTRHFITSEGMEPARATQVAIATIDALPPKTRQLQALISPQIWDERFGIYREATEQDAVSSVGGAPGQGWDPWTAAATQAIESESMTRNEHGELELNSSIQARRAAQAERARNMTDPKWLERNSPW